MLDINDIEQIKSIFADAIKAREFDNAYGVALVPAHTHDNTNSGLIDRLANLLPIVTYGVVAPTLTPLAIGDIYVDTVLKKVYIATGIASSADWTVVN